MITQLKPFLLLFGLIILLAAAGGNNAKAEYKYYNYMQGSK